MKRFLLLFTFLFAMSVISYASIGSIEGKVKDKNTGEEIIGANVYLKGTTTGSSTDLDGNYRITNIEAGTYTIVVSYISYKKLEIENVVVTKNKSTHLDLLLEEDTEILEEFVVVAKRRTDTEMSMISSIKNSSLVISGVSKQQIERTQDKDAAEIVRRIPGITIVDNRFIVVRGLDKRYNTVRVNGATTPSSESDAKAFSFDAIPSSMLSRLTVYKTPAPELPADFGGACVEIETKDVPDEDGISLTLSSGIFEGTTFKEFYSYEGGKLDWLGFDDGTRALPSEWPSTEEYLDVRGHLTTEGKEQITEWSKAFNTIWTTDKIESANPNFGITLASTKKFNLKKEHSSIGNITSVSYSNSNDYTQYFKSRYESYDTINDVPDTMRYSLDDIYVNKVKIGVLHNWSYRLSPDHVIEFRNLYNHIGVNKTVFRDLYDYYHEDMHNKLLTELDFMSRNTYSGQLGGKHKFFDGTAKLNWTLGYAYADKDQPDIRRIQRNQITNDEHPHYLEYGLIVSNQATPDKNGRLFLNLKENIWIGSSDFEKDFEFLSLRAKLKAGIYFERKDREFSVRNIGIVSEGILSNYDLLFLPTDSVYLDENFDYDSGLVYKENTQADDSYTAESELIAGYVGLKLPLTSLLTVYGGVRVEKFRQDLSGFQNTDDENPEDDIVKDTLNFFPSINISYNLTERSLLRLAYGLTVNRPEFRELSPFAFYDFENSVTVYGNDTLKNSYIHNYDFRYEWYPTPSEIVTIGAFYKDFRNPIEMNLFPASNGWDFVAKNVDKATSLGVEIDAKKSFSALRDHGGFLSKLADLSIMFNAALIKSEVESSDEYLRDKVRPMQGQSPYIVNTGLYYQNNERKLMLSILYNVIGKRIIYVGTSENPHTYELPHNLLDFTVSKKFGEHWKLKAGVKDILNEEIRYTQTYEFNKDVDGDGIGDGIVEREQLIHAYNPGRRVNFSVTYRF